MFICILIVPCMDIWFLVLQLYTHFIVHCNYIYYHHTLWFRLGKGSTPNTILQMHWLSLWASGLSIWWLVEWCTWTCITMRRWFYTWRRDTLSMRWCGYLRFRKESCQGWLDMGHEAFPCLSPSPTYLPHSDLQPGDYDTATLAPIHLHWKWGRRLREGRGCHMVAAQPSISCQLIVISILGSRPKLISCPVLCTWH